MNNSTYFLLREILFVGNIMWFLEQFFIYLISCYGGFCIYICVYLGILCLLFVVFVFYVIRHVCAIFLAIALLFVVLFVVHLSVFPSRFRISVDGVGLLVLLTMILFRDVCIFGLSISLGVLAFVDAIFLYLFAWGSWAHIVLFFHFCCVRFSFRSEYVSVDLTSAFRTSIRVFFV